MVNSFFNSLTPFPHDWKMFKNSFNNANIAYKYRNSGRYSDQCSSLLLDFFYKDGNLSDKTNFDEVRIHRSGLHLREKLFNKYNDFNLYSDFVRLTDSKIRMSDIDIIYGDSSYPTPEKIKKDIFNDNENIELDYITFRNKFKQMYSVCLTSLFKHLTDRKYIFIMAGCRCVKEPCKVRLTANSNELKDDDIFGWDGNARGKNNFTIKAKRQTKRQTKHRKKK